ncbi:LPP20 family lipoprotein [Halosquirtibacter laminarini]|uniref:LPP20 family lipoprotein n=1 Tax=Halosquirtibacter laminarini TaxID=3374600 RepID=A0AC61NEW4_9BACT|nr:LPP20 family lipoprotein [Prolixibacteraceae bacterium]
MSAYKSKNYIIWIGVLSFFLWSCAGTKKSVTPVEELPSWVTNPPVSSLYYVGIGSVEKTPYNQGDYRETARKSALSEISNAISVEVRSNTSLQQSDDQSGVSHHYQSNIITQSSHLLKGVELVNGWENDHVYWGYYRLSKQRYQEQLLQECEQVLVKVNMEIKSGDTASKQYKTELAISHWVRAISLYNTMKSEIESQGLGDALDQKVWSTISKEIASLKWQSPSGFRAKRGGVWDKSFRQFTLVGKDDQAVASVPVLFDLDGGNGLDYLENITDNYGESIAPVLYVKSTNKDMGLSVRIDMKRWVRKMTNDIDVRRRFCKLSVPQGKVSVVVLTPTVSLKPNGKGGSLKRFMEVWRSKVTEDHLLALTKQRADYQMMVRLNVITSKSSYGAITAEMVGRITVKDSRGVEKWNYAIDRCSGTSMNKEEAIAIAYKKLVQRVDYRAYPQMVKFLRLK